MNEPEEFRPWPIDSPEYHAALWSLESLDAERMREFILRAPAQESNEALDAIIRVGGTATMEVDFFALARFVTFEVDWDRHGPCVLEHITGRSKRRRSVAVGLFFRAPVDLIEAHIREWFQSKRVHLRRVAVDVIDHARRRAGGDDVAFDGPFVERLIADLAPSGDDEQFRALRPFLVGDDEPAELPVTIDPATAHIGSENLAAALGELGSRQIKAPHNDASGASGRIAASEPGDDDTAATVARAMERHGIDRRRQLETSLFAPQWAPLIGASLGCERLEHAVAWIRAHVVPSTFYDWGREADWWHDPIVDVETFLDFRPAIDDDIWIEIRNAAIRATPDVAGPGHLRVQTWADALDGTVTVDELERRVVDDRDTNALVGVALVALPAKGLERAIERRRAIIDDLQSRGDEVGSSKRATERTASLVALRNLDHTIERARSSS